MSESVAGVDPVHESLLLWRAWFEAGSAALKDRQFTRAVEWLDEAILHLCPGGAEDGRRALTEAALAYACYRRCQELEVCHDDPCQPKKDREREGKLAKEQFRRARELAGCALPRLNYDDPKFRQAEARANFVLGELCLAQNDLQGAQARYDSVYKLLSRADPDALLEETIWRQYQASYRREDFARALICLQELESRTSQRSASQQRIAWLLACQADCQLHLGHYRQADDLYPRWNRLQSSCVAQDECSHDCAYGLVVFGRARATLGHLDEADGLLRQGERILERSAKKDPLLLFDARLARSELARRVGEYYLAYQLASDAELLLEKLEACYQVNERRVRLCLANGRRYLALGQFEAARERFQCSLQMAREQCHCQYFLVVPSLLGLARIESEGSHIVPAKQHIHEALCCLEQASATVTAEMAWTLYELAYAYVYDNKVEQADPICREALQILAMSLRPAHPDEAQIRLTLAQSLSGQHGAAAALDEVALSLSGIEGDAPCDLLALARALWMRGEIAHTQRDLHCALETLNCADQAWREHEQRTKILHPGRSFLMIEMAAVERALGRDCDDAFVDKALAMALKLKCTTEYVGYELNRRGNLFFSHKLYREAAWLYGKAAEQYAHGCGPDHAYTQAAEKQKQNACERLQEGVAECPCSPCYQPCVMHAEAVCPCPQPPVNCEG